jgi:hypothetical protein
MLQIMQDNEGSPNTSATLTTLKDQLSALLIDLQMHLHAEEVEAVLAEIDHMSLINAIKHLREKLGLSLKDAKELAEKHFLETQFQLPFSQKGILDQTDHMPVTEAVMHVVTVLGVTHKVAVNVIHKHRGLPLI